VGAREREYGCVRERETERERRTSERERERMCVRVCERENVGECVSGAYEREIKCGVVREKEREREGERGGCLREKERGRAPRGVGAGSEFLVLLVLHLLARQSFGIR
jgi:hypothetical protein